MMTVKQYLSQIKSHEDSVRRLQDLLYTIHCEMSMLKSPSYDSDRVQSSNSEDKMLSLIIRYSETETRLTDEINRLLTVREKIIHQIESLENDKHREVLYLLYVKHMRWDDIANAMHYSRRRVEQLHGTALLEFQEKHFVEFRN